MKLPLVAIIGRPNVGKSTLFNRLTSSRKSIVGDEPGITRDRIYGEVEWKAKTFDWLTRAASCRTTKQLFPRIFSNRLLSPSMNRRRSFGSLMLAPVSRRLMKKFGILLRNVGKPVFIAANKAESRRVEEEAAEFYQFGFDLIPISAEHGTSVGDLIDEVFAVLDFEEEIEEKQQDE